MTLVASSSGNQGYFLSTYSYEWPDLNENNVRGDASISRGFLTSMTGDAYPGYVNFAVAEPRRQAEGSSNSEQAVLVQQCDAVCSNTASSVPSKKNRKGSETDARVCQDNVSGNDIPDESTKTMEKSTQVSRQVDTRATGARPKVFIPKPKDEITMCKSEGIVLEKDSKSNGGTSAPDRGGAQTKRRKVREKTTRKWKPLSVADFGFHLSVLPHFDLSCESDSVEANCLEIPEIANDENSAAFFESMGLDIHNDCCDDDFDEFIDWDGLSFLNNESNSQTPAKNTKKTKKKSSIINTQPTARIQGKDTKTDDRNYISPLPTSVQIPGVNKSECFRLFELECSSTKKIFIRRDKHRRVQKAHKAVKSKNCSSIFNNKSRKSLYMHHRLVKMHKLCLDFRTFPKAGRVPPMPKKDAEFQFDKRSTGSNYSGRQSRPAPAQNLNHVLHETNTPGHLETDLTQFLISLQHREMTPEDYDMLLRLDDSVKPKTVSQNVLDTLKTETVGPSGIELGDSEEIPMCTVCMEPYIAGQVRKFLPCGHNFHSNCIDTWLSNSSLNCPLDGLPVGDS